MLLIAGRLLALLHHHAFMGQLVCTSSWLDAVSAAIAQHAALPHFLVRQMAEHSLPAAVAALALDAAAETQAVLRQPGKLMLQLTVSATAVLLSSTVQPAAHAHLQRHRSAMLQTAQQLVAALPLPCQKGREILLASVWAPAAYLLAWACDVCPTDAQQGSQSTQAEQQAAAWWAVVQSLPRFAATLPLMVQVPHLGLAAASPAFQTLLAQCGKVGSIASCDQLQQVLEGANAALCVSIALQPGALTDQGVDLAEALPVAVLQLCSRLAQRFVAHAPDAAQLVPATAAAVQLHANGCRVIHRWVAADGAHADSLFQAFDAMSAVVHTAAMLLGPGQQPNQPNLCRCLAAPALHGSAAPSYVAWPASCKGDLPAPLACRHALWAAH